MSGKHPSSARRSYGTGSIVVRADANGRETFYGRWWAGERRLKRRLGAKRGPGSANGLTVRQAEAELRRQMAQEGPQAPLAARLTVSDVGKRYIAEARRKGRKTSTVGNLDSELRTHIAPYFRGKTMESIRTQDVAGLIRALERKKRSPKTIRNVIATLSAFFNYAMLPQQGWVTANPCRGASLPGTIEPQTRVRLLTLEELDRLLDHVPTSIFRELDQALILTAAMTGLRKGELVALRWRDVDWPAQRIRVERNYTRGEYTSPKSRRTRSVPMTDEVAGTLDRLYQASSWQAETDLVFAHPATGGPLPKSNISRRMSARQTDRKLPDADIKVVEERWADFKHRMDAERRRPPRAAGRDAP